MADLSNNLKVFLARELQRQFTDTDNSVALFIGQTTEDVGSTQTVVNDYKTRKQIQTAKLLTDSKATLVIPRINWSENTIYDDYDPTEDLTGKNFYVYSSEGNVYICLENGGGLGSKEEPRGTSVSNIVMSNGYVWKFVYKIPTELLDFVDDNFIPIKELPTYTNKPHAYEDADQLQYAVQYNAVGGRIEQIKITTAGDSFPNSVKAENNFRIEESTPTTVKLPQLCSTVDDAYNEYSIRILNGTGAGQIRRISGYSGAKRTVTVESAWSTQPDITSYFEIIPSVVITGDGVNASAFVKLHGYAANTIENIMMIDRGSGYKNATAVITPTLPGTNPVLLPLVSAVAGIGAKPLFDLFAKRLSILIKIEGRENGKAILGNDYRQFGLWLEPKIGDGHTNAGKLVGTESYLRTTVDLKPSPGQTFNDYWATSKDYIFGSESYNTGKVANETNAFQKLSTVQAKVKLDGLNSNLRRGETVYTFTLDSTNGGYTFTGKTAVVENTLLFDSIRSNFTEAYRCTHMIGIERTDGLSFDAGTPYGQVPFDSSVTGSCGSVGNVAEFASTGGSAGVLYVTNLVRGSTSGSFGFTGGETLSIYNGSAVLELQVSNISPPELDLYSGDLLYISSIEQVKRNIEQLDLFKINFDF